MPAEGGLRRHRLRGCFADLCLLARALAQIIHGIATHLAELHALDALSRKTSYGELRGVPHVDAHDISAPSVAHKTHENSRNAAARMLRAARCQPRDRSCRCRRSTLSAYACGGGVETPQAERVFRRLLRPGPHRKHKRTYRVPCNGMRLGGARPFPASAGTGSGGSAGLLDTAQSIPSTETHPLTLEQCASYHANCLQGTGHRRGWPSPRLGMRC